MAIGYPQAKATLYQDKKDHITGVIRLRQPIPNTESDKNPQLIGSIFVLTRTYQNLNLPVTIKQKARI